MNLAIIEDRELDLLYLKTILNSKGKNHNILSAGTIKDGIELVENNKIDCILLDMHLPDGEEIEAFNAFFDRFPHIPIVLLTADKDEKLALQLMGLGAQDFLIKTELSDILLEKAIIFAVRRIKTENELRELNATKDKFFSIMADDLRNPLSLFQLSTENLLKEYKYLPPDELEEFLHDMNSNSKNVYNLLENLLTWSRTQRGIIKFNPDIVSLKFVIQNNISIYEPEASNKNITIEADNLNDIKVYSDSNLINIILKNLINNAIKFTPENGKITIGLTAKTKSIDLTVTDTGIGMDQKTIDNLFNIAESISRLGTNDEKGTGLGLIVCKEFADLIGAELIVTSTEDQGTTFNLQIPNIPIEDFEEI